MRLALALLLVTLTGPARAQSLAPPDPPRWRIQAGLGEAVGGAGDGSQTVTMFTTALDLAFRVWKPLSLTAGTRAVLAGEEYLACGKERRPNAIVGSGGVRVDFANGKSASWVAPFLEVHGGVGRQGVAREVNGVCGPPPVFGTGGARAGLDVWLGRVAVTLAVTYDYLPTVAPYSVALGASVILW